MKNKNIVASRNRYLNSINNNLGYEYKDCYGIYYVKVLSADYPTLHNFDKNGKKANKQFKYILRSWKNWIDAGNPIPAKNEVLFHLDGDNANDDITNLKLVSRSVMATMAKKKRYTKNKKINNTNLILTELEQKIRSVK